MAEQEKGSQVPQAESCKSKILTSWTEQEKWVWGWVCEGKEVNLNLWPESQTLRSEFQEMVLLNEPYRSSFPHQGFELLGPSFENPSTSQMSGLNINYV